MTDAGFTVAGEEHAICPVCIFIEGLLWLSWWMMMNVMITVKDLGSWSWSWSWSGVVVTTGDVVGREVEPGDGQDDAC